MSATGVGLFHDDVAVDVRNDYLELLSNGASDDEAFRTIVKEWKETIADSDDGPVFWLALAATQWEYGRLNPQTKSQALKIIDQAIGLDRWVEAGLVKRRQAVLGRLRKKLISPPAKKRTPRLRACPDVASISLASPDEKAIATAFQLDPTEKFSQVCITMNVKRNEGGGSVFVVHCDVAEIKLQWLDADTLRITYPKKAEVEDQAETAFYCGRTVAVKYRRV